MRFQQVKIAEKTVQAQGRQFLEKIKERLAHHQNIHVHPIVKKGNPGEEILKLIHARGVDLVVLGMSARLKTEGLPFCSVTYRILHDAPCSIFIARNPSDGKKSRGGMKILLAIDGSPDARAAADFLQTMTFLANSHLTILHVVKKSCPHLEPVLTNYRTQRPEFLRLAADLQNIQKKEG